MYLNTHFLKELYSLYNYNHENNAREKPPDKNSTQQNPQITSTLKPQKPSPAKYLIQTCHRSFSGRSGANKTFAKVSRRNVPDTKESSVPGLASGL